MADADAREERELYRRLVRLELVVSGLAEDVRQLLEDVNALRQARQERGDEIDALLAKIRGVRTSGDPDA